MTTDELESLLEGALESPNLEFKTAVNWSAKLFVKDILAMANAEDGGTIVVGVTNALLREGVDRTVANSYSIDRMRDEIAPFASPSVEFSFAIASSRDGKQFIVIRVLPFSEQPVICARNGHDVNEGVVYSRSLNGRARSAAASAHEMRRMLEVAAAKFVTRFRQLGLVGDVSIASTEEYDVELGDL